MERGSIFLRSKNISTQPPHIWKFTPFLSEVRWNFIMVSIPIFLIASEPEDLYMSVDLCIFAFEKYICISLVHCLTSLFCYCCFLINSLLNVKLFFFKEWWIIIYWEITFNMLRILKYFYRIRVSAVAQWINLCLCPSCSTFKSTSC